MKLKRDLRGKIYAEAGLILKGFFDLKVFTDFILSNNSNVFD
jgi:hypothetical protein